MFAALQNSSVDWGYHVEKSHKASRSIANDVIWPRGKFIGGSGGMNVNLYIRGNARDYDNWEQMGNPSWGWQNVSEYFKKSEDNQAPDLGVDNNNTNHGIGGPLKVNWINNEEPFKQVLLDAAKELGYNQIVDINGNEHIGLGVAPGIIDQGMRSSSAKAFLAPAKDRANLHVIKHAHVTKVNVDNSTGTVLGVEFIVDGVTSMLATVSKEVILSAGSVGTPQILQLSGIGPEKQLRWLNISTVRNLNVGYSLQDHIYAPMFLKFNVSQSVAAAPSDVVDDLYNYIKHKKGVFSEKGAFDLVGFFNTVNLTDAYPNIGTHYVVFKRGEKAILTEFLNQLGYNESVSLPILDAVEKADIAIIFVILLNPLSMGKIRLRSADPLEAPFIKANYLDRREDVATLVQGIQLMRNFYATPSFNKSEVEEINMNVQCEQPAPIKIKVKPIKPAKPPKSHKSKSHKKQKSHQEAIPETIPVLPLTPQPIPYGSDQYWECYVRHFANSLHHPVGTAKMGPATDRFAVVDSQLNVHGLKGLRIIDASVMPKIVSGNTNAATIMIAEKGSDFIREDWPRNDTASGNDSGAVRDEL